MKKLIYYYSIFPLAILLVGIVSCKKETPEDQIVPTQIVPVDKEQDYFVIGSDSFNNQFRMFSNINSSYSSDSSFVAHFMDLGGFSGKTIIIYEYRNYNAVFDSIEYRYGTQIEISAFDILSEGYEYPQLRTRNSTGDSIRTLTGTCQLPSYSDTVWHTTDRIAVPMFFNSGDTVYWNVNERLETYKTVLYKHIKLGYYPVDNIYEEVEINHTDILDTNSKFIVVKFSNPGMDPKFGVIEISINPDTLLMIHDIYTNI